ncbi:MAG: recombinase family protein, partial [Bacteriovoracaceae bacterium]|nr:recombinase family protein [Bacteriovoracaceae bacterium]
MTRRERAIEFDRVSSAEQREGQSLQAQRKCIEEYAERKHLKIVKAWSVDESASKEADRKLFFEAVEYMRKNKIKHILFDKVDRCCRGFKTAVLIEQLFEHEDVTFYFTRQNLVIHKNSPAHDKTQLYFHIMFAKIYVENLKSEIKKGSNFRYEKGLWNYKAPLGYLNVRDEKNQAGIEIDVSVSDSVKKTFELYSTGNYSLEEIGDFVRKTTGRKISVRSMEGMISNPFYCGKMKVKGAVTDGVHEAIISKKLFDHCQMIRSVR